MPFSSYLLKYFLTRKECRTADTYTGANREAQEEQHVQPAELQNHGQERLEKGLSFRATGKKVGETQALYSRASERG